MQEVVLGASPAARVPKGVFSPPPRDKPGTPLSRHTVGKRAYFLTVAPRGHPCGRRPIRLQALRAFAPSRLQALRAFAPWPQAEFILSACKAVEGREPDLPAAQIPLPPRSAGATI